MIAALISKSLLASSEACPTAESCRFYVLPPSVSVLCPSSGCARSKVQGKGSVMAPLSQVRWGHPMGLFQFLWEGPIIAFRALAWSCTVSQVELKQVELCVRADTGLPNPRLDAAHAATRNGHTSTYFRAATTVRLHMGAKIAESMDKLHLVARH